MAQRRSLKEQLQDEEQGHIQLEQRLSSLLQQVHQANGNLQTQRATWEQRNAQAFQMQQATAAAQAENNNTQGAIVELRREADKLRQELSGFELSASASRQSNAEGKSALGDLQKVVDSLRAVHGELRSLSSEAAKKAAREAAGGDLDTEIVPPPVPEVGVGATGSNLQAVWQASDASMGQARPLVRDAMQSQAVFAAVQHSLVVRATELREGLRQWGFAQGATKRTEELCTGLKESLKRSEEETSSAATLQKQLREETEADAANLVKCKAEKEALDDRHAALCSRLSTARSQSSLLEEKREAAQKRLEEAVIAQGIAERDAEEASRQTETRQKESSQQPAEASRRLQAADRLVKRSCEQTQKAAADLGLIQQEHESFLQAHSVLKESSALLEQELQRQRDAHAQLVEQHQILNFDLNSLAQHYIDLLPASMGGGAGSPPVSPVRFIGATATVGT